MRGVILVSLENASFHMVHVYTINWFKKVQNINNYCSHAEQPTFNCHKRWGGRIMAQLFILSYTDAVSFRDMGSLRDNSFNRNFLYMHLS